MSDASVPQAAKHGLGARQATSGASVPPAGSSAKGVTTAQGWLLGVVAYLFWGFLSPGGKLLLEYYGPLTLNAVRMVLATLLLAPLLGRRRIRGAWRILRTDRSIWLLGGFWLGATFAIYAASLLWIEATIAALFLFLAPFMVGIAARPLLGERQGPLFVPAAVATLAAAYATIFGLVSPSKAFGSIDHDVLVGLGLAALSVVGWAGYTVHLRMVAQRHGEATLTLASFVPASLFFIVTALLIQERSPGPFLAPLPLLWMALYVLFPSVGAYLTYAFAVKAIGAGRASVLIGVELVATAILARLLLNEPFPPHKLAGMMAVIVIVTGFIAYELRRKQETSVGAEGPA